MANEYGYTVRPADWASDKNALRQIRDLVFIEEQGVPAELEHDGEDASAIHLIAEDLQGEPIGTGRLLPTGQIGRMAVMPAWRNCGVGHALMRALLTEASSRRLRPFLNAQQTAKRFYLDFGFSPVGPEFMEAGIAHQRMEQPEKPMSKA
jgi:predicted GNAT family N-acyltransferase